MVFYCIAEELKGGKHGPSNRKQLSIMPSVSVELISAVCY